MVCTQKELARLADVSIVTIHNALHQPHKVKKETRDKIFELMRKNNYLPNGIARSMVRQKTNIIGILIPSFKVGYYAELICAIERTLNNAGYRVLISQHCDDPEKEFREINMLQEYRVDGIIMRNCGLNTDEEQITRLAESKLPFVLIDGESPKFRKRFIGNNDMDGAIKLVQYLISLGRKRIAYMGFHCSDNFRESNRYKGYKKALELSGIDFDPQLTEACLTEYNSGELEMEKIMERCADNPPDAVFAFNDNTALNAINYLFKKGYAFQDKILVAGYGGYMRDLPLPFKLPTIQQNVNEIGNCAALRLVAEIEGKSIEDGPVFFSGELKK
jgi:LacI family transcriptional regulator